ncbi:hypothetical protein GH733_018897 [Mirounga leonina]|nr:hypothetical protein GH733_018897 [Mirounga leonina]
MASTHLQHTESRSSRPRDAPKRLSCLDVWASKSLLNKRLAIKCVPIGKFMKSRKVVQVLAGHYSGQKVVIMKNIDNGTSDHPYNHALVTGIDHYSCKVTAAMGKKKITKSSKIKSFVKVYNCNHLMSTSYCLSLQKSSVVECSGVAPQSVAFVALVAAVWLQRRITEQGEKPFPSHSPQTFPGVRRN